MNFILISTRLPLPDDRAQETRGSDRRSGSKLFRKNGLRSREGSRRRRALHWTRTGPSTGTGRAHAPVPNRGAERRAWRVRRPRVHSAERGAAAPAARPRKVGCLGAASLLLHGMGEANGTDKAPRAGSRILACHPHVSYPRGPRCRRARGAGEILRLPRFRGGCQAAGGAAGTYCARGMRARRRAGACGERERRERALHLGSPWCASAWRPMLACTVSPWAVWSMVQRSPALMVDVLVTVMMAVGRWARF